MLSTLCVSWRVTSNGWRAWSPTRRGSGTRPIPSVLWTFPPRTTFGCPDSWCAGRRHRSTSGAVPWAGSGYRMEIYGREGTLITTGSVSSQRGEMLRVQGAQGSHELQDLPLPQHFVYVPDDFPRGDPFNVGQLYALFAEAIQDRAESPAHIRLRRLASTASWTRSSRRPIQARSCLLAEVASWQYSGCGYAFHILPSLTVERRKWVSGVASATIGSAAETSACLLYGAAHVGTMGETRRTRGS